MKLPWEDGAVFAGITVAMLLMFAFGWRVLTIIDARTNPTYLLPMAKCDPGAFVTVKFPGGGEFVCVPARLPFPTKRPGV